ncbi:Gfo/Idh/MocA family oxidoreductase [Flavihumibacter rivuli]|uniref:Gfo/Idh/MocA family protein n=1 Tax=Flavihumibacter rivuli TaxID=2838156 RepID=UPI001BDEC6BD|nr:Gfo/Idh/MocA family oxidoreductase [Flavihumibacter rivuli]ULQ58110.1 Gfo/Idh/MocA family oxidoreductase [Flavihumibacter rivuli]
MANSKNSSSRRKFLQNLGGTALLLGTHPLSTLANGQERIVELKPEKRITPNDRIRVAVIGTGIMGHQDLNTALKVPGVELAGACDLYAGRLERMKELYGKDIFVTNDYRAILDRKDIDAVIVATSDNWHARIATEALQKGKAVYLEKPMVHRITEGLPLIAAQKASGKVLQVGSQRVSSIVYAKAKELYLSGDIGKLNMIEASFDRQSALGAWQYTMPIDGSPETVSWDRYIAGTRKIPYDSKKFFWWRNYRDFGTGVAGDLFVHLLSGVHVITGSMGPVRIFSSGQLSHWKDGRDVPDVMTAIMEYPETPEHPAFQLSLKVNFISGGGDTHSIRLIGEEGVMEVKGNSLLVKHSLMPKAPGMGGWDALTTYPKAMQDALLQDYNSKYSAEDRKAPRKEDTQYKAPAGYNEHLDHFTNFFDAIRTGKPVVEDAAFGFRAAAPCLACNDSYFEKKIIQWDPVAMKVKDTKSK